MAAIFGPELNTAAKFGPRGPDVAAIFGPTAWDQIWQQNSVLVPNMAAIFRPRTKYGCNILSSDQI